MIELNDYFLKYHEYQLKSFEEFLSIKKNENIKLRQKFLSEKLSEVNLFKEDCYSSFFIQFMDYFDFLSFSENDEIIISKLKDLGFTTSLKYLTNIDNLELEIRRLDKIDGLLIFPYNYLFACYAYLTSKFKIESYESFQGTTEYNGIEVNNLFMDTKKRVRRKNIKTSPDEFYFDKEMRDLSDGFDRLVRLTTNEIYNSKKILLKIYNGNYRDFLDLFQFHHTTISKNAALEELFPLFMLIFKDKKLLNEPDFFDYYDELLENSGEQFYDKNYRKYKISRVRDILKEK
jgi:hypothetical protein